MKKMVSTTTGTASLQKPQQRQATTAGHAAGGSSSSKVGMQEEASSKRSSIAEAFFRGEIRDRTTKESRKAAESLSALKTIKKNPSWVPVDSRTKMLKQSSKSGLPPAELAKMRAQVGDTVPSEVVASTMMRIAEAGSTSSTSKDEKMLPQSFKNPMLCDVEAEIHRRIKALGKSGKMFEEGAAYHHDQQLAADAPLIVQGIDPQAARSEDRYVRRRVVVPQRKHWMASKVGFYTTPYGMAYVHTDGSVAMFSGGSGSSSSRDGYKCLCGAVHMP